VVLVDDHAMLRVGLQLLLEQHGITVVGEAENGAEAVKVTRSSRPDMVVMDLSMPVMDGIAAATEIRREPGTPTILLTVHRDEEYVVRAFEAGVAGYVLKSMVASDLVDAIREVRRGKVYLSPGISKTVLTQRERQVLQLIAEGHSTKEASRRLGVGLRTGDSHRLSIMKKLELHGTASLVLYAIREGLIEP